LLSRQLFWQRARLAVLNPVVTPAHSDYNYHFYV